MLNSYVVKGKKGYYAELIQHKYPHYKGLDGIIWPLWEGDAQKVKDIDSDLYVQIKQCVEYNQYNIIGGCSDLEFLNQYIKICRKINLSVEVYNCIICEQKGINEMDIDQYLFLGYDYVLRGGGYSPLVQEIEIIRESCEIRLNDNGLLETYADALSFVYERKRVKKIKNNMGFEFGEDFVDYCIVALFQYIGNFPIK